jgi:hypothetical protein
MCAMNDAVLHLILFLAIGLRWFLTFITRNGK